MRAFNLIQFSQTGQSTQIDLSHAPLNIINFEMMSEISEALDKASASPILILSTKLQHFSTGVDVNIHTPDQVPEMLQRFHEVVRKLYHFPGLSLCAIRGYSLGGGMELALCCDVILAESTSSIGFPEITIACFPPVAAVLLPRLTGRAAHWLLLSGESITAERAHELGIIDHLYEDDSALEKIMNRFFSLSPDALCLLKGVIRKTSGFDFDEALSIAERVYKEELLKSPDVLEGAKAFLEKRQPQWRTK